MVTIIVYKSLFWSNMISQFQIPQPQSNSTVTRTLSLSFFNLFSLLFSSISLPQRLKLSDPLFSLHLSLLQTIAAHYSLQTLAVAPLYLRSIWVEGWRNKLGLFLIFLPTQFSLQSLVVTIISSSIYCCLLLTNSVLTPNFLWVNNINFSSLFLYVSLIFFLMEISC